MPFSLFGSTDHIALMYFGALLIGEDVGVVGQRALRGEVSRGWGIDRAAKVINLSGIGMISKRISVLRQVPRAVDVSIGKALFRTIVEHLVSFYQTLYPLSAAPFNPTDTAMGQHSEFIPKCCADFVARLLACCRQYS
ncbi:hypothetical protein B0H13DRAFT_1893312 [Mycena leptocephala]|nr:hypothetical protein B0H13DRAFT_1893312 [Mycena leptocephala]